MANIGERNRADSERKATAAGQRVRFESGSRLGSPIPDGYKLEPVVGDDGGPRIGAGGRVERRCVLDTQRAPLWRRIFDLVERGHEPGEVPRALNAEGFAPSVAGPWTTRKIRRVS